MPQPGEPPAPHPGRRQQHIYLCRCPHVCSSCQQTIISAGFKGKKTQCHLLRRRPGAVCGEAKIWGCGSRGGFAGQGVCRAGRITEQEGSQGRRVRRAGGVVGQGGSRHAGLSVLGSRWLSLLPAAPLVTSLPQLPMWFIRPGKRGERQRGARGDSPGTALPGPATLLFAVPGAGSSHRVPVRRRTRPPRAVPARKTRG